MSPSVEKLYGWTVEEFIDNPNLWVELTHPDDRYLIENVFRELQKKGISERETRCIKKDGTVIWVHDRSKFIYDKKGHPIRIDGYVYDISERKKFENELILSKNKSFL